MNNFEFYAPTHIYFGKGYVDQIGSMLVKYGFHKPLIVYGSGSVKRSGLYDRVIASLEKAGLAITGGEITMIPQNYVSTDDQAVLDQMERLVDALEDSDDVQNVYTNLE